MEIISHSTSETVNLGKRLSRLLNQKDIVCLFGRLGSGKTMLVKGIAEGLRIDPEQITSPSFVLIREYKSKFPLYHFDLYRLKEPKDILGLGYEEYLYSEGVSVIEWADRLGFLLPQEHLSIRLAVKGENTRKISITARGKNYERLVAKL